MSSKGKRTISEMNARIRAKMGEGKDMIRAVAEKQEEDSKHRFATLLAKVRAENAERRGKKRANDIQKVIDRQLTGYLEESDDSTPHASDFDELITELESGKNVASTTKPFFYYYGGYGTGQVAEFNTVVMLADEDLISGDYHTSFKMVNTSNKKMMRKLIDEVHVDYEGEGGSYENDWMEAGYITLTVKTTDANRKKVIDDLNLVTEAINNLVNS